MKKTFTASQSPLLSLSQLYTVTTQKEFQKQLKYICEVTNKVQTDNDDGEAPEEIWLVLVNESEKCTGTKKEKHV